MNISNTQLTACCTVYRRVWNRVRHGYLKKLVLLQSAGILVDPFVMQESQELQEVTDAL